MLEALQHPELVLPATRSLLESWNGVVLLKRGNEWVGGFLEGPAPLDAFFVHRLDYDTSPGFLFLSRQSVLIEDLALYAVHASVRDHIDRVYFQPQNPNPRVRFGRCFRAQRAGHPMGVAFGLPGNRVWYEGGEWWDGGQGHSPDRFVPELAKIDPESTATLPDGSSGADAAGLVTVARFLQRSA